MPLKKLMLALTAIVLLAASAEAQTKEKAKPKEKEGQVKLFQLEAVEIEVVEKLRDIEIPNMTVVKPEFFPMGIGTTLDTALERQPGVDVQRIQEIGTAVDDDSIKLRGFGSRRIKVLKNGRLMNTSGVAGGYFIDWTMLPLANVERIEVVKGVGDPRYGNVLGGIINLVPRRPPTAAPGTELQISFGSFESSAFNLHHAYKPGAFEYALVAGINRSRGYLKNGNLNSGSIDFHLGYDFEFSGRLTANLTYSKLRKGFIVPNRSVRSPDDPRYGTPIDPDFPASDGEYMYGGMGAYPEPGSWWEKSKGTLDLGYEQALAGSGLLSLRYWRNFGEREAYNTRSSAGRIFHKTFFDDRSYGLSGGYRHNLRGHTISAGIDFVHLKDDGDRNLPDDFRAPFRNGYYVAARSLDLYLMDEIPLLDDRLILTPGIRYLSYDGISGPSGEFELIPNIARRGLAPSLKLTWAAREGHLVYVSAARALRMPTPPEHYWHYDFDDAGVDTSMLPFDQEDGLMIQGGWRAELSSGTRIEIAPYFYAIRNYIQFDLINFVAYNIEKASLYGIEIEAAHQLGDGWSVFANVTFQRSRTEGDPFIALFIDPEDRNFDRIPGLPRYKVNLGVQYRVSDRAGVAVFLQGISSREVIYNNNRLWTTDLRVRTQDAFARVDIEGRTALSDLVELRLFARNILDARYQERYGFPAAGRNLGLSLNARF